MDEHAPVLTNTDLYAKDFYAWCLTTAARVRDGQWDEIDLEALAEELESLGKSQQRELGSRLETLVAHLLKWHYQPDKRQMGHSWEDTIIEQRNEIDRLLEDNPSLRPRLDAVLTHVYPGARRRAIGQMDLFEEMGRMERAQQSLLAGPASFDPTARVGTGPPLIPILCPWQVERILDHDFWPGIPGPLRSP